MTSTLLHTVVRVMDTQTSDVELLARFAQARDEIAFEELVRRHGPLVWTVCRQLLPHHADAEDAFQAVFLALIQGAESIRAGKALPAWLHGVALRVAVKAKRTSGRRRQREERVAAVEANQPVPDATWSSLMAAVHEEVQRLPDEERTAFILCELEGVRQPDAAARLGWPLGTLSGRLCKARQRLIDQLTRRDIVPGVLIIGGLAGSAGVVPAALMTKVSSAPFAFADGVSSTVAALAHGLIGGTAMRTKMMVAALFLMGAMGLSGSSMILSNAGAQAEPKQDERKGEPKTGGIGSASQGSKVADPGSRAGGLPPAGGGPGSGLPPGAFSGFVPPGEGGSSSTTITLGGGTNTLEYKFVDLKSEDRDAFEKEIKQAGTQGWEFCGSERLRKANEGAQLVLVFKKRHGNEMAMSGFAGGPGAMGMMGNMMGGGFGGGQGGRGGPGGGGGFNRGGGPGSAGGGMGPGAGNAGQGSQPGSPGRTNQGLGGGSGLDAVESSPHKITVLKLKHAKAEQLANVLQQVFSNVDITPEGRTNQLILRASAQLAQEVGKLVSELDVEVPGK